MSLPPSTSEVLPALTNIARHLGAAGQLTLLSDRADAVVARVDDLVLKAHPIDTNTTALRTRLHLAANPLLHRILVPPIPIDGDVLAIRSGRLYSAWPYGEPVSPDNPDAAPWEEAAMLLAHLHNCPPPASAPMPATGQPIPAAGAPNRVRRAMDRLRAADGAADPAAAEVVWRAYGGLPALGQSGLRQTLVHGDFHLGQLVRMTGGGENPWRLVDVDDLGLGDPVWDLARPAGFFAAGILDPVAWERFIAAYQRAGGVAVPSDGEVWTVLDGPARALVVQAAAIAVAKAGVAGRELDELDTGLVDSCYRMSADVS